MFRVMIVDDEPVIKKSICKLIEMRHLNFDVVALAKDGEEAFEKAVKISPDVIITDVRMPKLDGIGLLKRVKETLRSTKVVVVSGYDEFEYVQHALRDGAVDYILKPLKPETFYEVMEKVEEQLHERNLLMPETRDWLWEQKKVADQLVEAIWDVNPVTCKQVLETCLGPDLHEEKNPYMLRQLYSDLSRFIQNEVDKKLGVSDREEKETPITNLDSIEEAYEKLVLLTEALCNEVQRNRDWNCYSKVGLALQYIEQSYRNLDLTLQEVAHTVDISPSYLSRLFKEEKGISFVQYVTKLRMCEAQTLLKDITLKTYEVADRVGYTDYPHFTKTFKKYTGVSPKEFRKNLGKVASKS